MEMANVLIMAERHGRMDAEHAERVLASLLALPIHLEHREPQALAPAILRTARAHRLSAYDAAYLELAMRAGLPLATNDASLRAAADRVGVPLFKG